MNDAEKLSENFDRLPDFDGIFAVNALNLSGCINVLRHRDDPRLRTTRFVNFDDIGLFNIGGLSMSAIQQSHRIGFMAGEILINMIAKWRDSTFHIYKNYYIKNYSD